MADLSSYNKNDKVTINKFINKFVKSLNYTNPQIPSSIKNTLGRTISIDSNVNSYLTSLKKQKYYYSDNKINIYNMRFTDISDFLTNFKFPIDAFPEAYKLIESKDFTYAINNIVENHYQYSFELVDKCIQYIEMRELFHLLNNLLINNEILDPIGMKNYNDMFPYFRTNTGSRTKPAMR